MCGSGSEAGEVVVSPGTEFRGILVKDVPAAGEGYGGTDGLAGSWVVLRVYLWLPPTSLFRKAVTVTLGLSSDVPSDAAGMNRADLLLPGLFLGSSSTRVFGFTVSSGVVEIAGRFGIEPDGRRIVARVESSDPTNIIDVQLGFVLERV